MRYVLALLLLSATAHAQVLDPTRQVIVDKIDGYLSQDAVQLPPKGKLVITGSSTIALWTNIKTDLAPLEIVARGVSRSIASDINYYLNDLVLKHQPSAVAIYEGDNDIASGVTPQGFVNEMKSIATKIHAKFPQARIYFISIKPSRARFDLWSKMQEASALLKSFAATDPRYSYIKAGAALEILDSEGLPKDEYYAADDLHFSLAGYAIWGADVKAGLMQVQPKIPKPPSDVQITEQ